MSYQDDLKRHLTDYKKLYLSINKPGEFRGRGEYGHILPKQFASLNLFEEVRDFRRVYKDVKLHRFFHHLNSSQAFAINLFFPFFCGKPEAAASLLRALGSAGTLADWEPEWVPEPVEGTNIDIAWRTVEGVRTICEVKLSETDFGKARDDQRHRDKFSRYFERLVPHLDPACLERLAFFGAYQFNRNVYHMVCDERTRLIFLLPKANQGLWKRLNDLLKHVKPSTRDRISVVFIESVIEALSADQKCPKEMRDYALRLEQKYVI